MDRRRQTRPALEAMETRQVLSTIVLGGLVTGSETTQWVSPPADHGISLNIIYSQSTLSGAGKVRGLGEVHLSGNVAGPITLANAKGTLTIEAAKGTPTNEITGAVNNEPFTITGGTGAYRGAHGAGAMVIVPDGGANSGGVGTEPVTIRFTHASH